MKFSKIPTATITRLSIYSRYLESLSQEGVKIIASDKLELIDTIKADNAACVVTTSAAVDKQATKDRKRGFWVALLGALAGGFIGHAL